MAKVPMNARFWREGKCIGLNDVICVAKNPFKDMFIINSPKRGCHLHISGFRRGVITIEEKESQKWGVVNYRWLE